MIELVDEGSLLSEEYKAAVCAVAKATLQAEGKHGSLALLVVDEAQIRQANREHRRVDSVTDVLSFPAAEPFCSPPDGFYGDILLCPQRAIAQAQEYGHSQKRELTFLTVHGVLHLLGYDHEWPEEEAIMREKQKSILERMGFYADHT